MRPDNPNDLSQDPLNFDEEDDLLAAEDRLHEEEEPKGPSLADIVRNNPSLKIFGIVLVIGIFLIVFLVFGGGNNADPSIVRSGNDVTQPPGTTQLPPAYEEAVRSASEQRAETAEINGGSALPTPIGTPERIEAPPTVENTDPLAEWRQAAEARANERRDQVNITEPAPVQPVTLQEPQQPVVVQQPPAAPPPLPTGPNDQDIQQISQRLSQQMQSIVEAQVPPPLTVVGLGIPTGFEPPKETAQNAAAAAAAAAAANTTNMPKVIIPAGTIGYAQTLIEANSDVQGPILAELASGPLSGARLIGSFQMNSNRFLTLRFTMAIYKGREYTIDTYALDPETTLPAMATDVDRHYFSRIVIPAAAKFLQGYAQAISQRGTTVVVNNSSTIAAQEPLNGREQAFQGASEAMNQVSQVVQDDLANRPVTVKVAAGTRMGLLFIAAVTEASADPAAANAGNAANAGPQATNFGGNNTLRNDPRMYGATTQQQVAPVPANNAVAPASATTNSTTTNTNRPFLQSGNTLR